MNAEMTEEEYDIFYTSLRFIDHSTDEMLRIVWRELIESLEITVLWDSEEYNDKTFILVNGEDCIIFNISIGAIEGRNSENFRSLVQKILPQKR